MSETKKTNYDYIKALNQIVSSGDLMNVQKKVQTLKNDCGVIMQEIKTVKAALGEQLILAQKAEAEKATELAQKAAAEAEKALNEAKAAAGIGDEPKETKQPTETVEKVEVKEEAAPKLAAEVSAPEKAAEKPIEQPKTEAVEKPIATEKAEVKKEASVAAEPQEVKKPVAKKAEAKVEAKAEVKPEAKPAPTEEEIAAKAKYLKEQSEAAERAANRAREIEARLKKFYSENGRENNGNQNGTRRYDNRGGQNAGQGQGQNRTYDRSQNNSNYRGRPNSGSTGGTFNKDGDDKSPRFGQKKPIQRTGAGGGVAAFVPRPEPQKNFGNKKKDKGEAENKKVMTKRTLLRKGFVATDDEDGEDKMGNRKLRPRKDRAKEQVILTGPIKIERAVVTTDIIPIKTLSDKLGKTAAEITKKLFAEGIMKTVNESIDFDTAELIALGYNIELVLEKQETAEEELIRDVGVSDEDKNLVERPPVVTVMGHVDHGKTSLLDAIRHTSVTEGEAGGITQHIGAYMVEINKRKITFIDTPGHEAFTAMRKRGAMITDIAILVVAGDDGIMPQTVEAINHIKAAGVEMIVAVNKMDKPGASMDRIMQQLTEYEIVPEAWGGKTIVVPVSAKTKAGISDLLESVLLVADVLELKANPKRNAVGVVVEAQLDKGRGPMATILVKNGTLKVGDTIVSGVASGRIRAMIDDKGRQIKSAPPSTPVSVLGFDEVPVAGEQAYAAADDKLSKAVVAERISKQKEQMVASQKKVTLDEAFKNSAEGELKVLNLIVKADVQGSLEAVKQSLMKLSGDEASVKIIHGGVGAVNESDVTLASTSGAVIIAFNVRPDAKTKALAERFAVEIKTYRIIYDAINEVSLALKGMLAPIFKEVVLGQIEVRSVFKITGAGTIAGGYVTDGKVTRNAKIRLIRQGNIIHDGVIASLKRFKDDVKEVAQGYECGIGIENYNDIKEGDVIEAYINEEVKRD